MIGNYGVLIRVITEKGSSAAAAVEMIVCPDKTPKRSPKGAIICQPRASPGVETIAVMRSAEGAALILCITFVDFDSVSSQRP